MTGIANNPTLSMSRWIVLGVLAALVMPVAPGLPVSGEAGIHAAAMANEPWWDPGWHCRRTVTISDTGESAPVADCQVLVNLTYDSDMRPDFGDLRFIQYNQTAGRHKELPYYIEQKTDRISAQILVKVSEIQAGTTKIHVYYSNPSATSTSDLASTYHYFESFDTDPSGRWTVAEGSAAWDSANKWYSITNFGGFSDTAAFRAVETAMDPIENIEVLLKVYLDSSSGAHDAGPLGRMIDNDNGYGIRLQADDYFSLRRLDSGESLHIGYVSRTIDYRTWYWVKLQVFGSTVRGRVWATTVAEPGTWDNSVDDSTHTGPGHFGIVQDRGGPSRFDDIRIAKLTAEEPVCTVGAEELPFTFKSAELGPPDPSEGDLVTVNVTFSNPTSDSFTVNISFSEGDELQDATLLAKKLLALAPRVDSTCRLDWTATGGEHTIWVSVSGSVLASFPLSVNWLPTLDYIPDQRLMQDWPFMLKLTARDKDGEAMAWSEDSPLFDFSKTTSTGAEIAFVPKNDDVGVAEVNFSVTDPHGCTAAQLVRFTIENVNDPPWLEYIPNLVANEEARFSYRVNASDADSLWGDTLAFSDDSPLFDIDPKNGAFSFVPTNAQVGKYLIEVTATDNQSAQASRRFNLTVQNQNDPPVIEAIPPQTATQGKMWQVIARSSDPDQSTPQGDKLRFGDDSPLFDINPESGLITFTPANKDVGLRTCNITVSDMAGASCSTKLQLSVLNVNDPPVLDAIPDQTAVEEVPFELTAKASDADVGLRLDNLTFSDDSPLLDIDPMTGKVAFTPTNKQVGRHTIKITVRDESGATASRTFTLTVQNVNDPPYNVSITSLSEGAKFREGDQIWLNATGSDEDAGDRLTFAWLDNGVEAGKGKSIQVRLGPGDHLITLEVSDGLANVTAEVSIKVARAAKEQVTVQNDWWIVPLLVVIAIAAAVGVAFAAMKRPKRKEPEALPPEAGVAATAASAPAPRKKLKKAAAGTTAEATVAATAATMGAAAAPALIPPADKDKRDKAQKALNSAEDAIADGLESGADTTEAMESLDIARDFFKSGDFDEAATYAGEAEAAALVAGAEAGSRASRPDLGKLACPGCGEELQPEWPTCPVCGHKTR